MDGVIVVDKPEGPTSHDVVNRIRRLAQTRKVGHLGTLDPLATGVLPLVIGRATRLSQFFSAGEKKYDCRIRFGHSTDTYDRDGISTSPDVEPSFSRDDLERTLREFRGRFLQTPPPVSAKKVAGTPAYKLARKQIEVELEPVEVNVLALDLLETTAATARIVVHCSTGTYVRSIAHEVGQRLGCGGFVDQLRRTASGEFSGDRAHPLDELNDLAASGRLAEALIPAAQLLPHFPNALVDTATAGNIRQGKDFRLSPFRPQPGAKYVKALTEEGDLIAIGEARLPHLYHPVLVL